MCLIFPFRISQVWTRRVHLCKRCMYTGRMALWWGQRLQGLVRWGQLHWWEKKRLIYTQTCKKYTVKHATSKSLTSISSSFCLMKWVTTHVRAVVSSVTLVTVFLSAGSVTETTTARTAQTRTLRSVVSHKSWLAFMSNQTKDAND